MPRIKKAVITAAGLGTRLLPATKGIPKEMLPIFARGRSGQIFPKPIIQAVFEQLFDAGIREFFIVVGRGKKVIEDHFTIDMGFLQLLRERRRDLYADEVESFYEKVSESEVIFLEQPEPKGFGDAVLRAEKLIDETFIVHAGDTYIVSNGFEHFRLPLQVHERWNASATLLVREVDDPERRGIMGGELVENGVWKVERVEEKPEKPWSRLAILPIYIFEPEIFEALAETLPGRNGEVQLTDGVGRLLDKSGRVMAVKLSEEFIRLDIGNPRGLWEALDISYKLAVNPYLNRS
ncbi:MAG: hypothetical protein J7L79_01060 [Thaumarchaeota archaeon]|nr:hypothetical protein [Nitrososphaerota archaeon]